MFREESCRRSDTSKANLDQLLKRFTMVDERLHGIARALLAHLNKLIEEDKVSKGEEFHWLIFKPTPQPLSTVAIRVLRNIVGGNLHEFLKRVRFP